MEVALQSFEVPPIGNTWQRRGSGALGLADRR